MNKIMSLLACTFLVFVESQSLVDGPGMSFVGGIFCPQASQTCCDNLFVFVKDSFSLGMDWAAVKFVWVRLPKRMFHPGEMSGILVLAHPPNRKCCRPLRYAEFRNRLLYSSSWVVYRWALVPMAPVTGGYIFRLAESDFVGLSSSLLR